MSEKAEGVTAAGPAVVFEVPEGKRVSPGAPGILALPNGKLLVSFDLAGPDVKNLTGKKGHDSKRNRWMQGRVMCSADGGATWQLNATFPFRRASLFRDGGDVYLIGEASGGLCLMRSPDGGGSWSAPMELAGGPDLWLSPTRVVSDGTQWYLPCQMPCGEEMGLVVFRAPCGASLMNRKAWTCGPLSEPLSRLLPPAGGGVGVPCGGKPASWRHPLLLAAVAGHPWMDEGAWTVFGATSSGREHWAAFLRLDKATLTLSAYRAPDGAPWTWLPLPGGHEKFDLFYDEPSRLYWTVGSRGTGGWVCGGADGENRLGLWTSANLAEWTFTAVAVSGGTGAAGIRCDPAAAVAGNDLKLVCLAGGAQTRNRRELSRILCVSIPGFRSTASRRTAGE